MARSGARRGKLISLGIGVMLGFGAALGLHLTMKRLPEPPPLVLDHPGDATALLRHRFPVGSLETDLVHELWIEGFQPRTDLRSTQRSADWERLGDFIRDICAESESVNWSANTAGQITGLSARRYRTCP
jgi:hypothetical protein